MQHFIRKLAGAGFCITILFVWAYITSNFSLYETGQLISNGYIWLLFFGYGLLVAVITEYFIKEKAKKWLKPTIYVAFGFVLFYVFGLNYVTIIASFIGALSAYVFYVGEFIAERSKIFRISFAFVLPLVFLILSQIDLSIKNNWKEIRTEDSYSVSFDYFDGEQRIPIYVEGGESLIFTTNFKVGGAGRGLTIKDEDDEYVGLNEIRMNTYKITAERNATYYIIIRASDAKGIIEVTWKFE